MKGSGTDLATITPAGFAVLRLDDVLPLRQRAEMDDATMVDYLVRCGVRPDQPRPSIETLLHAFVSAPQVDHTHPDAIIALTSSPRGRALCEEEFGDEAVWLDYQRPGFDMSARIAALLDANPAARAVLLAKHGLVTWGETGEESYRGTIEFVTRAAQVIDRSRRAASVWVAGSSRSPGRQQFAAPPRGAPRAPRSSPCRLPRDDSRSRPQPRGGCVRFGRANG